uniref:Uncharacterized protein n=1 Tax=Kalanchoe fedtschenkoi TaxID=63787 RepID=A0A7N0RHH1_KALFE
MEGCHTTRFKSPSCAPSIESTTTFKGPFFSEVDLATLASHLDSRERQMMTPHSTALSSDRATRLVRCGNRVETTDGEGLSLVLVGCRLRLSLT